jgi:hypothetical protein
MPEGDRFRLGLEDWAKAVRLAEACSRFVPDVEEEQVADEAVSCYNCRFRRWAVDAVTCMAAVR